MDYFVWNFLSKNVYGKRSRVFTDDELKEIIRKAWDKLSTNKIRNTINSWKKRPRAIVQQDGGPVDHLKL